MAWFIVSIMVLSVLGIISSSFFSEEEGKTEYGGFTFARVNNQWRLKAEGKDYYFQHLPQELENLTSPGEASWDIPKIYLGFQPKDELNVDKAINQIAYVFYNKGAVPQKACITEEDCPDIPIMNCQEKQGVVIVSGEKNGYTQNEKCLRITAINNEELEKLTERLIYQLLGVMN